MQSTILLVDDEPNVLYALVRGLRHQPYRIFTATSAEEAMVAMKSQSVDLLVTDEQMTGMPGTRLLAWVAEHFPDVVRIVLTGHPSVDLMLSAVNEGRVFRVFTKPCNDMDLALAIREGLDSRLAAEVA
ncbi:MAG: response regulator [Planctomycetales bacterium]|nr:response regulator [Planctomycetales bacterium]